MKRYKDFIGHLVRYTTKSGVGSPAGGLKWGIVVDPEEFPPQYFPLPERDDEDILWAIWCFTPEEAIQKYEIALEKDLAPLTLDGALTWVSLNECEIYEVDSVGE